MTTSTLPAWSGPRSRPSVEAFVTELSAGLIGLPPGELDNGLDAALRAVAAFTGCDRVYLCTIDGELARTTHAWCAPDLPPLGGDLPSAPTGELPWMLERLRAGEAVRVDSLDAAGHAPAAERVHRRAHRIRSLAAAPVHAGGPLTGFLCVDAVREAVRWSEQDMTALCWLADAVGSALALRESHEALQRSEARYRAIVEEQTDLVCRYRPDTTLTFVNRAYASSYGCEPEDLVGRSLLSLLPRREHEWAVPHIASLGAGRPVETHEHPVVLPDGATRWYQWTDRAIFGPDGAVVEIQAVGRDISDRRTAETALRESEERFRGAFEHAPIGMVIGTFTGRFLRVNRAFCDLLGYTEAELLSRTATMITHPEDETHEHHLERLLSGEASSVRVEKRYLRADGRVAWGLLNLSLIRDSAGEPLHLLGQIVDITDRKHAEAQLAQRALQDPLTGLPNRVLLLDRLEQALARCERSGAAVAVLFCNLDHFRMVNDSLGPEGGDQFLVAVAERLRAVARAAETVARFGSDEFVLVTEGIRRTDEALELARRLLRALEAPVRIAGSEVVASLSIGVALAGGPAGGCDAGTLVRDSNAAMSRAKHLGGNRVAVCDDATRATTADRLELLNALRGAADRGELRLHYQPIARCSDGEAIGAEALVRWAHPTHGLLMPETFLPLAEQTGLMALIGAWVLQEACRQAARWTGPGQGPPFQVWVNLSAQELARPDLATAVAAALAAAGADPAQLCVEVSEHAAMADPDQAVATLAALRALGVRVAIDDFGTGYSSLASLSQLPLDTLKIDRSFVEGLGGHVEDHAILRAIVDLAHGLGLDVVAEGIEDREQMAHLRSLGCDFVQGYLVARPLPPEDVGPALLGH